MCLMTAEELGIPYEKVRAVVADTGTLGYNDVTDGSRTTFATGMACILAARDGGTVLFFSMATSFTAAALGAEGVGKDAHLVIGNGYVPGHADLALGLLRANRPLRALFEARYAS
jgi:L-erythro-3,5-diaminohexanoate dehydrogenase